MPVCNYLSDRVVLSTEQKAVNIAKDVNTPDLPKTMFVNKETQNWYLEPMPWNLK